MGSARVSQPRFGRGSVGLPRLSFGGPLSSGSRTTQGSVFAGAGFGVCAAAIAVRNNSVSAIFIVMRLCVALAVILCSCGREPQILPDYGQLPEFSLSNQAAQPFSRNDL